MKDGLGADPSLGEPPPSRTSRTIPSGPNLTAADEVDADVLIVSRPMTAKIGQECRPVRLKVVGFKVLPRKGETVIDTDNRRAIPGQALDQPVGEPTARPVQTPTRRRVDLDRLSLRVGNEDPQTAQARLCRLRS